MVCRASVNYDTPFQAGRGVTQGGPLSAKLFNVLVDAIAREWLRELREGSALKPDKINHLMATFFAIFYVDDAYLASRDPELLKRALDVIVGLFSRIGLETNAQKMQTMICTPGRIRIQLPEDSYARLCGGTTLAGDWNSRMVLCHQCNASMMANSLPQHLAEQHDTYQVVVVPEDYLAPQAGVRYQAHPGCIGKIPWPVPGCPGELQDGWMLQRHCRDLHPFDRVVVPTEGYFPQCERCRMQVNSVYPRHIRTKECGIGMDRQLQRESAISSALALRHKFNVGGTVLERVEVFKYLGRLLAQDNDDAQAIRQQLRKARGVWAQVGQVLHGENATPWVAAKFYKAVVQAILLYGSKTWNLTASALARLEGFHIHLPYKMVREHQPRQGANHVWTYPRLADVLEECRMQTIAEYIRK
jgi:hypothetical protein